MGERLISMSRSGRYVAIRQVGGVDLVDAIGTAPRQPIRQGDLVDFACVGSSLWIAAGGKLHRYSLESGKPLGASLELDMPIGRFSASDGIDHSALWSGVRRFLIQQHDEEPSIEDISDDVPPELFATSLAGRRVLIGDDKLVRVRDAGRGDVANARLPNGGTVTAGAMLFGGRALAVMTQSEDYNGFVVVRSTGALIHHISVPSLRTCAIAGTRGIGVTASTDGSLSAFDLRYGRKLAEADGPIPVDEIGIDTDGKYVMLGGFSHDEDATLSVLHLPYTDLFGGGGKLQRRRASETKVTLPAEDDEDDKGKEKRPRAILPSQSTLIDAAQPSDDELLASSDDDDDGPDEPIVVPGIAPLAFGRVLQAPTATAPAGAKPYANPREHLEELLDLVAARTARAIAQAWDSGRLSLPAEDARPFEKEVQALVGKSLSLAPEALAEAEERLSTLTVRAGRRALASIAAGMSLPFVNVAREFNLTTTGAQVLLVGAAPALRGEIARLYGVLANDENRPICDRYLVELILGGERQATRHEVAKELELDSPLVKHGLIHVAHTANEHYLFASISVDRVLLSRLRGNTHAGAGAGETTDIRIANRTLDQLVIPDKIKHDIVVALAQPAREDTHPRVIVRGRLGSGRRSLLAALAARGKRPLAVIDCERMPRRGRGFSDALRTELHRAGLRGAIPCISGLELFDQTDQEAVEHVRGVFRTHPGPITFRTSPEYKPLLDPGYLSFTLPHVKEADRLEFWIQALARRGMIAKKVEQLAARFRIGPGTIERVLDTVQQKSEVEPIPGSDLSDTLDEAARQHIDTRMGNVATHVTRLARWEQVALPEDVFDSLKEFIGRIHHRRTVYDNWGFDQKMTTSRGLTALFYGPPGTGKSMVAGLIARELGLDLYRVDLARVTSKWIGETEKNLAEVFDAAEDGQVVVLFDEADSLFAKRTEVKSSVDRYANLEVNYLLQRLDTFEGVAILTTNLEGSLDNAFKRRLSLRLAFPFPDEEMRVRLWAAHLPAEVPTAGDFDFEELAKKFPLSGGYIRNCTLRAAFLAAQEGVPLSHEHLLRAIQLEYRELGKLSAGGRME